MEEILSSIRRIIADEDAEGSKDAEAAEEAEAGAAPSRAEDLDAEVETLADAGDEEADDVLELTKMVRESGEIVDLKAETGEQSGFEAEPSDALEDPEEAELAPPDDAPEEETDGMSDDQINQQDEATVHAKQSDADELMSTSAASVASGSIAKLNSAFQRTPAEDSIADADGRTIEQFAEDMLRPMLKDWLDQHLPSLIERVVEREIRKIARRAETY